MHDEDKDEEGEGAGEGDGGNGFTLLEEHVLLLPLLLLDVRDEDFTDCVAVFLLLLLLPILDP